MRRFISGSVACAILLSANGVLSAPPEEPKDNGWKFIVTPYFMAAALDGKTGVGDVTTQLDVPFSELLENLSAGFMGTAEAHKGRWIIGIDAIYFKVSDQKSKTVTGPFGQIDVEGTVEVTASESVYQPTLGYRVMDEGGPTLDLYVAARYTGLDTDMYLASTTSIPSFPGGSRTISESKSWWDPVIGGRIIFPIRERFMVMTLADFGGFGVGSEVAYQWMLVGGWKISKMFSLDAGYRYFKEDYDQDNFVWDMVASGFLMGVGIAF